MRFSQDYEKLQSAQHLSDKRPKLITLVQLAREPDENLINNRANSVDVKF